MALNSQKTRESVLEALSRGNLGDWDPETLTQECDRIVRSETEVSSASALKLGRQFVNLARKHHEISLATACRAYGWALLVAGKYEVAEKTYLEARQLVRKDPLARGRIDRVLIDVYMYLGRLKQARRHANLAMRTFEAQKATGDLARTRVNYANLLHRQDKHRQAQKLYHEAAQFFESQGVDLAVAFCHYNEANTLVQLFDFAKAEKLYERAEKAFNQHGHNLRANGCRYGLAWLHMLEGNYHVALKELAQCEREYARAGQPREVVLCQLDLAETYLGLNLFSDAVMIATEAERRARKLGIVYESAKGAFFAAKANLGLGRRRGAGEALKRARDGFAMEKNESFLAAADFLNVQMKPDSNERIAGMLKVRRRFMKAELPLWEAICDMQYLSESPGESSVLNRLSRNPAVKTVPHLFARRQTILGDRAATAGRSGTARKHWTRAAEVLDAVRAKLPPVDMRTAFTRYHSDPHRKLVRSNLEHDVKHAAAWSERLRTAGLWTVPDEMLRDSAERQRVESTLTELACRVTNLSGQLAEHEGSRGGVDVQDRPSLRRLQRQVRQELASLDRSRKTASQQIEHLCSQLETVSKRQTVVQFHSDGSDLIGFVHDRGKTRYNRYSGGSRIARELMGRWRFMVERAVYSDGKATATDLEDERQLLTQIGDWLWSPLEVPSQRKRILILPDGQVSNLPWQAVIFSGLPLVLRHELVFSPSLRHHLHADQMRTRSERIEVFIGATEGLEQVWRDFSILLSRNKNSVTIYDPCRRQDWPDNSQARIWHYAGHAQLRSDNPFYSSLSLVDGPLFAADLRLKKNRVGLVTLAACRTGQQAYLPGEESTGLVRSLLEMGVRNVIASQWAVSDQSTAHWMDRFYSEYLSGKSVTAAAKAAMLSVRNEFPSAYNWAAFSAHGAG